MTRSHNRSRRWDNSAYLKRWPSSPAVPHFWCNHLAGHIRLNTELVKKPKDLLEYIIVHEMAHLSEPTHSDRFTALLDRHYPTWREARAELNELPLSAESWKK